MRHRRLAYWRKARGIAHIELASRVGRSRSAISRYESGARDVPDHIWRVITRELAIPAELWWRS